MRRSIIAVALTAVVLLSSSAVAGAVQNEAPEPNIVDVALAANSGGDFDTLIAAVTRADQAHVLALLQAKGQRTVFAPTDAAFAAANLTPQSVLTLPADVLSDILAYHVTAGRKYAADVLAASSLKMLNGDRALVDAGAVTIDGAPIVATDIAASNGVIHVVGGVLVP